MHADDKTGGNGRPKPLTSITPVDTAHLHSGQRHSGLPPLDLSGPPVSFYEFWPPVIFYFPVYMAWAWLMMKYGGFTLPSIANPLFPYGGMIGETKDGVLDTVLPEGRAWIAPYRVIDRPANERRLPDIIEAARDLVEISGLGYPVVAKPTIGARGAGVRLVKSPEDLESYIRAFPGGQAIMLQKFVPFEAEAGVFYIRMPGEERGRIFSLTLKYFPYVVGDGHSTLRTLIERDPRAGKIAHIYFPRHKDHLDRVLEEGAVFRLAFAGSHSRGTIFRDGAAYITPEMTAAFDRIAKSIPEFHFGRFDVRFPSLEDLQRGENFVIVEINGAGAEATHIWDSKIGMWQAYKTLWEQYDLLYKIGGMNKARGFRPLSFLRYAAAYYREMWIVTKYPLTE